MAKRPNHVHAHRIVAHTTDQKGRDVRVLLGCACGTTETIKPHQGRNVNADFFYALQGYEHLCCNQLPADKAMAA